MTRTRLAYAATGESIDVNDWLSLSSLVLYVAGMQVEGCGECPGWRGEVELEFPRAEVQALRDRLTDWLNRGVL